MTAMRPTSTIVLAGRPSGRPRHERFLQLFTRLEAGEGRCLLLFFGYAFLLLVSYYILRTLREPLLLVRASPEMKTYASAAAALALLVLVPLYGAAFRRTGRNQLVRWVTGFFVGTLGLLYLAGRGGLDIGFAYYVWAGVFGVAIVAQFWAHAADCFDVAAGRRLFPVIMTGATLGGIVGPSVFRALQSSLDAWQLMLVALVLLALTLPLVAWSRSSVPPGSRAMVVPEPTVARPLGGFSLIARDRYLLLIALLIVLLNCVNTMGEYLLTDFVVRHADEQVANQPGLDKGQLIGEFYASYFLVINLLTVVTQVFLVARLFRWVGVSGALLLLPIVALLGYGLVACVPIFALLQAVKVLENSGNYSVLNTARQALFLPLAASGKYEGKIATDTFFWRIGDLVPAAIVFAGVNWLELGPREFALVNIGLSLAWLVVAVQLAKRSAAAGSRERSTSAGRVGGGRRLARPRFELARGAAACVTAAVAVLALTSSAPARAADDGIASSRAARLFDEQAPLELEIALDWRALCRNPQRSKCEDSPATLVYRDAAGEARTVAVALRTRGRYRADTVECALPALFVFFTDETLGTLFAGESMLPLTTHCGRTAEHEQYLLKEFLAYRLFNALTEKSLRVRLARVTYRDTAGKVEPLERYAFFTEHFDSLARRLDATIHAQKPFDPRTADAMEIAKFDLFQYAIGNTDWSAVYGHNVLLVDDGRGRVTPVPFDFDFSGLVDAAYATVAPQLRLTSVRQRIFRGVCRDDTNWSAAFALFAARRDAWVRLVEEIPDLERDERAGVVDYIEDALAVFESPAARARQIVDACRSAGAGD